MSARPQDEIWQLHPMAERHLSQVLAIENVAYTHPWTEGVFRDCLKVGYSAWVITDISGMVLAYSLMTMAVGEAHVLNLCVAPKLQRQGLGAFQLRHLQMLARAGGCELMLLEVRRSNLAAQRLYEGFGFRCVGERPGYYPDFEGREDAFVLALDLK